MVITKGFFSKTYECFYCEKEFKNFTQAKKHEDDCSPTWVKTEEEKNSLIKIRLEKAKKHEKLLEFDKAANIYKGLGMEDDVIRVREEARNKVSQTVVHGDYVDDRDTIVKDSVINRSNVGGSSSKMQELEKLTEMKEKGLIDDDEFQQMKKEILGK